MRKNWDDSETGVIYLADSPEVAESYAETSDLVPEAWLDDIIVFQVDVLKLRTDVLFADRNVQEGDATFEYHDMIHQDSLKLL